MRILVIVAALTVGVGARPATTEADRWREDLRVIATEVPRTHKSPFHTVTRADFDAAVTRLDERIPSLTRNQIIVELARIVASIGDGHTRLGWPTFDANGYGGMGRDYLDADPAIGFRQYPLRLYAFDDGLHVIAASEEHASIVGGRVVQVGSAGVDAALAAVSEIVFHDNAMSRLHRAAIALTVPEIVQAFGWTDREQARFVIEKGGARHTIEVRPVPIDTTIRWVDAAGNQKSKPLWLRQPENNYWFEYLADDRLLYFQYNAVRNNNEETLADFFKRLFAFAAAHPIDKFVIDLRHNAGGNTALTWPLIYGLIKSDSLNVRGRLFVLIGRATFSAAMNTAVYLEKHTNAIFVGEPTGSRPNQYGDTLPVMLPHSGIAVHTSFLYWQEAGPRDARPWIAPRVTAPLTSADYRNGVDPALNAVRSFDLRNDDLAAMLARAYEIGGLDAAMRELHEFTGRVSSRYGDFENDIRTFGQMLMRRERYTDAVVVFRVNTERSPSSLSAPLYLGLAARAAGDVQLAIASFRRALELNPVNSFAAQALKELLAR